MKRLILPDSVTPGYSVVYDDLAKEIRVEPIPEPGSAALAIVAMMAAALSRWRKSRRFAA